MVIHTIQSPHTQAAEVNGAYRSPKTDVQSLPTTLESWENGGRQQHNTSACSLHKVSTLHSGAATVPT